MQVKQLIIKNIGLIAEETIELNKPLILFYGEIRQGKTTILNCVRWVCGGAFPSDIIRHGEKEAAIELVLDNGSISRTFYVAKDGKTVKARDVVFIRDGKPVKSPVAALQAMLNPFLLDQNFLVNMGEIERKRYFAEMFKVDTTEIDRDLSESEAIASGLRSEIKGFGEIAVTPVEPVDESSLKAERSRILQDYQVQLDKHVAFCRMIEKENEAILDRNAKTRLTRGKLEEVGKDIVAYETRLRELKELQAQLSADVNANPEQATKPNPEGPARPDTTDIDARISNAAAANVSYANYQRELKRAEAKAAKQKELEAREDRQRELRKQKLSKLSEVSKSTGIPGLAFDDKGEFVYHGTQAGMLSTSEIMRLSSELSALYPEGFGLELIDRGESLGKSIFEFVDRAKAEDLTILATIVGERPAVTPPDVGVFVVEAGKIKP